MVFKDAWKIAMKMVKREPEDVIVEIIRLLKSLKPEERIRVFESVAAYFHTNEK